jgi:hypothetical protein
LEPKGLEMQHLSKEKRIKLRIYRQKMWDKDLERKRAQKVRDEAIRLGIKFKGEDPQEFCEPYDADEELPGQHIGRFLTGGYEEPVKEEEEEELFFDTLYRIRNGEL